MPASPTEPSPIDALPRPLAIVAHDAGAANMIASWCAGASAPPDYLCAKGPAAAIFARIGGSETRTTMEQAVENAASVITGTGWASNLEHAARSLAARQRTPTIAVIDHWVNYESRFSRSGEIAFPDKIVVGDTIALGIAQTLFPQIPVEHWPNTYLATQVAACGPVPDEGDTLFVAEPARSDWGRREQGEFQALDWFVRNAGATAVMGRLRPHPSDPAGKYDAWLAGHAGWSLDSSPDLATAMRPARHVAGLNSMAMVVALEAGRQVTCAIPPWGPECLLPQEGIARLAPGHFT